MSEDAPPYGDQEEPEAGMVGIRLEGEDLALLDQLRKDQSRAAYARKVLRTGMALELVDLAEKLKKRNP